MWVGEKPPQVGVVTRPCSEQIQGKRPWRRCARLPRFRVARVSPDPDLLGPQALLHRHLRAKRGTFVSQN
jgi:hypothetical protein